MFDIGYGSDGEIVCSGRLDAAQSAKAQAFMDDVTDAATVDFSGLEYISSAGLGVLLKTQKRLAAGGGGLKMEFEPHLPETSCTVRMSWQTD